jgi:hypothetical protein
MSIRAKSADIPDEPYAQDDPHVHQALGMNTTCPMTGLPLTG